MSISLPVSPDRAVDAYTTLRPLGQQIDYLAALVHEWVELADAGEMDAEEMLYKLDRWVEEMDEHRTTCIKIHEALSDQAWNIRRVLGG